MIGLAEFERSSDHPALLTSLKICSVIERLVPASDAELDALLRMSPSVLRARMEAYSVTKVTRSVQVGLQGLVVMALGVLLGLIARRFSLVYFVSFQSCGVVVRHASTSDDECCCILVSNGGASSTSYSEFP